MTNTALLRRESLVSEEKKRVGSQRAKSLLITWRKFLENRPGKNSISFLCPQLESVLPAGRDRKAWNIKLALVSVLRNVWESFWSLWFSSRGHFIAIIRRTQQSTVPLACERRQTSRSGAFQYSSHGWGFLRLHRGVGLRHRDPGLWQHYHQLYLTIACVYFCFLTWLWMKHPVRYCVYSSFYHLC